MAWLLKVGMGWLGYTEEQALAMDMQSIESAYRGKHEMLEALAGKSIKHSEIETAKQMQMTPELFKAMFGGKH